MQKYKVYTGAYGVILNVLKEGEGDWQKAVQGLDLNVDRYCRYMEQEDGTHIDFGSWSVFVLLCKE